MFDFNNVLNEDEKILYQGKAVSGKGGKQIILLLVLILLFSVSEILLVPLFFSEGNNQIIDSAAVIIVITLFIFIFIYTLIYNLFLKKRVVKDDYFCLTNVRAIKYESKENKLTYGYLEKYENIRCYNVKDNYGDLYMEIIFKDENMKPIEELLELKRLLLNPDLKDMPGIKFESIENPEKIRDIAIEARNILLRSKKS